MRQTGDNPWTLLPEHPPFVLAPDKPYLDAYNAYQTRYVGNWIHTGRVPEPRQGPIDAPVIILQQNPSYEGRPPDEELPQIEVDALRGALIDEHSPHQGLEKPNSWWDRTCKVLIAKFGRERLARRVLSIEYFPYPSARFGHTGLRLPSQAYTFGLVRRGLSLGSLFVIMRGAALWYGAVPELYSQLDTTVFPSKNRQRAFITAGNLPEKVFDRLCAAI